MIVKIYGFSIVTLLALLVIFTLPLDHGSFGKLEYIEPSYKINHTWTGKDYSYTLDASQHILHIKDSQPRRG